jgi:hypothetical protein
MAKLLIQKEILKRKENLAEDEQCSISADAAARLRDICRGWGKSADQQGNLVIFSLASD